MSVAPADVQSYGFLSLDIVKTGLILLSGILATYNHKTKAIDVLVKYPAGIRAQAVHPRDQHRSHRLGASTYRRLDGDGRRRALTGYAPGTYFRLHAATPSSAGRSDLVRAGVRDRLLRVCSSSGDGADAGSAPRWSRDPAWRRSLRRRRDRRRFVVVQPLSGGLGVDQGGFGGDPLRVPDVDRRGPSQGPPS